MEASRGVLKKAFLFILFVTLSVQVSALTNSDDSLMQSLFKSLGFAPDASNYDLSLDYLSQMFGTVGSALVGRDNVFISSMFRLFNIGVLSIAGTMIGYATAMSVVHTSGQGVFLGKKMGKNFAYIVTRQVAAVTMLLPQFNGYSALQVAIMMIVVKGVHLANYIWYYVSAYTMQNGSIVESVISEAAYDQTLNKIFKKSDVVKESLSDIENEVLGALKALLWSTAKIKASTVDQSNSLKIVWSSTRVDVEKAYNMSFCSLKKKFQYPDVTTAYTMTSGTDTTVFDYGKDCGKITVSRASTSGTDQFIYSSMLNAVSLMLGEVQQVANTNVDYYIRHCSFDSPPTDTSGCYPDKSKTAEALKKIITRMTSQIINIAKTSSTVTYMNKSENSAPISKLYGEGWATAVSSYLEQSSQAITRMQQNRSKDNLNQFPSTNQIAAVNSVLAIDPGSSDGQDMDTSVQFVNEQESTADFSFSGKGDELKGHIQAYAQNLVMGNKSINIAMKGQSFEQLSTQSAMNQEIFSTTVPMFEDLSAAYVQNSLFEWKNTFIDDLSYLTYYPIAAMTRFSQNLAYYSGMFMILASKASVESTYGTAMKYWGLTAGLGATGMLVEGITAMMQNWSRTEQNACWFGPTMFGTMCIEIIIPINTIIGIIMNIIFTIMRVVTVVLFPVLISTFQFLLEKAMAVRFKYISLFFAVGGPLMALGNFISMYIPSLPVIIFTLAVMGWLIAVIEAMIGAPLILLGMTSPQGHDVFGSSTQTLMLLFAVFIRPATLVISFVLGIISLSVMSLMTSIMLIPITNTIITDMITLKLDGLPTAVIIMMILLLYLYIFMKMIEMTLSMIFRVPYMVLRWIGVPLTGISEESALQSVSASLEKGASGISGGLEGLEGSSHGRAGSVKGGEFQK